VGGFTAAANATMGQNMWQIYQCMSNELSTPKILTCPSDERTQGTNFMYSTATGGGAFNNLAISYFVGKDCTKGSLRCSWAATATSARRSTRSTTYFQPSGFRLDPD